MTRYIAKRLFVALIMLVFLSALTFTIQRLAPTDPIAAMFGHGAPAEVIDRMRHEYGYDQPIPVQYVDYMTGLVQGDTGVSIASRKPVTEHLVDFFPASLELVMVGFAMALAGGVVIGLAASGKGLAGTAVRYLLTAGAAVPSFLAALLALLFLYRHLGWFPATGRTGIADAPTGPTGMLLIDSTLHLRPDVFVDALHHLALPAACIAIGPAVSIGRMLRSSVVGTLPQDYVRTARAKGLSEPRVLVRHVLRNCLNSTLAVSAIQCGAMFAGLLAVEPIFAWPGIGSFVRSSVEFGDYPAVLAVTLVTSAIYIVANTTADILQSVADPRIGLS